MMEASIECALARVTTGEWADALREVFGEYRPATGIEGQTLSLEGDRVDALAAPGHGSRRDAWGIARASSSASLGSMAIATARKSSRCPRVTWASTSSTRASGLTPGQIVESAVEENADVIGASVLSGSHLELADQLMGGLREAGAADDVLVVFGGIIPKDDFETLKAKGIARVFTPADYELIDIMEQIVTLLEARQDRSAAQ